MKKALITGITGQDGSYLAEFLLSKGYEVHGIIKRASTFNTQRIEHLYTDEHDPEARLFLYYGDLADSEQLSSIIYNIKPDEIYNLGAQSHVRVSFDLAEYTGNITGLGTTRILEIIRRSGLKSKFYQASSSEMFGATPPPQNENSKFHPRSPYAAAKLYSYWMVKNYREGYNMFTCNGILFNHECVTAETPVIIRRRGLIDIFPIEEIVPHRENPEKGKRYITLNSDLEVWDGNRWTKIKTMTATWNEAGHRDDKKVKRVTIRGGYYEATQDHISFLEGEKEIKTGDLKNGDRLELKTFPELIQKITMSLEEAELMGMMVADGYISQDGKGRFINNNLRLRKQFAILWEKVTGGWVNETTHPSGFNPEKSIFSLELRGRNEYLRYIYKEIYTEKKLKRIPRRILNASLECIEAFLRGYNKCDGLKKGKQKTEFKSFTTNSQVLLAGLWYLLNKAFNLRATLHPEIRKDKIYFHLNINSNKYKAKGKHLVKNLSEVKSIESIEYTGWLFDLETETGTFSAGVGLTWIHNSPRRGETFVTRKITRAVANILAGKQKFLYLGNLDAKRDWGYTPEYIEAMWKILQHSSPDDFVLGTGETHSVKEFVIEAFKYAGLDYKDYVKIDKRYYRPTEVECLIADPSRAKKLLNWDCKIKFNDLVKIMVDSDMRAAGLKPIGEGDAVLKEKFGNKKWWVVD